MTPRIMLLWYLEKERSRFTYIYLLTGFVELGFLFHLPFLLSPNKGTDFSQGMQIQPNSFISSV